MSETPAAVEVVASVCLRVFRAVDVDGCPLPFEVLWQRTGYLEGLTRAIAQGLVAELWDGTSVDRLASKVTTAGAPAGGKGYVAARRHGWLGRLDDVYVPDRVYRAGQEHAVRLLRGAVYAGQVLDLLVASWPVDPGKRTDSEWEALRAAARKAGVELPPAVVRGRTRQCARFLEETGQLPSHVTELEDPPRVPGVVLLPAADRQLVRLSRVGERTALLEILLPLCARPMTRADWQWVRIPLTLPGHVPVDATLHTPNLRPRLTEHADGTTSRRILMDMAYTRSAPAVLAPSKLGDVYTRALGLDWGVNTALTGAYATRDAGTTGPGALVETDGRPYHFKGGGIQAKLDRLRRESERLYAKISRLETLLESFPVPYALPGDVRGKLAVLRAQAHAVSNRRANLGRALAWTAARWALAAARSLGAQVIFIEDLHTLEGSGMGRRTNRRVSYQVRAQIFEALRHLASLEGIAVVEVPARGTSSQCPRCLTSLHHHAASNDPAPGWAWAHCLGCGHQGSRDHLAAERIVSRGLAGQGHTKTAKAGKRLTLSKAVDVKVRVTRSRRTPAVKKTRVKIPAKQPGQPGQPGSTRRVVCRDKHAPTPTRAASRQKTMSSRSTPPRRATRGPQAGRARLTSPAPATSPATLTGDRLVKRSAGTGKSQKPPFGVGQQASSNVSFPPERTQATRFGRARRQALGFHPHTHPTWIHEQDQGQAWSGHLAGPKPAAKP